MPALSLLADEDDAKTLIAWLNADPEIAFIIPDGPLDPDDAYAIRVTEWTNRLTEWAKQNGQDRAGITFFGGIPDNGYRQRWKAVHTVESLHDGNHSLWHVPSGPLPLLVDGAFDDSIPDMWGGWTEHRPGADSKKPYFGNHYAEIRLDLNARLRPYSRTEIDDLYNSNDYWNGDDYMLMVSGFQWIGSRYRHAPQDSWRWWRRLKKWIQRNTIKLSQTSVNGIEISYAQQQFFWAFPSALQKLQAGMEYEARGYDLTEAIRTAGTTGR
jgi:hypothetical protein